MKRLTASLAASALLAAPATARETVVLLHGLCRTAKSMEPMQRALESAGFQTLNVDYPSRTEHIEALSEQVIGPILQARTQANPAPVHFVAHSLGGILVRDYAARHPEAPIGRVVMLGPPNGGSEVVDRLGKWKLFRAVNGPAGDELSTRPDSTPNRLGPVGFQTGILAGNRSINWINSLMIDGPDDGKVSVAHTKLEGMTDHRVLPATHPFLMRNREAIAQTITFLRVGRFQP